MIRIRSSGNHCPTCNMILSGTKTSFTVSRSISKASRKRSSLTILSIATIRGRMAVALTRAETFPSFTSTTRFKERAKLGVFRGLPTAMSLTSSGTQITQRSGKSLEPGESQNEKPDSPFGCIADRILLFRAGIRTGRKWSAPRLLAANLGR